MYAIKYYPMQRDETPSLKTLKTSLGTACLGKGLLGVAVFCSKDHNQVQLPVPGGFLWATAPSGFNWSSWQDSCLFHLLIDMAHVLYLLWS